MAGGHQTVNWKTILRFYLNFGEDGYFAWLRERWAAGCWFFLGLAAGLGAVFVLGLCSAAAGDVINNDLEAEYDGPLDCTWCGGEGTWWGEEFGDLGWYLPDELYPCPACGGSGDRADQRLW